ncbi:diguanylate cyclase [Sphingomonas populi]|uniref:diguanylate cyclase n=1 Tax=Sphingomonas populi TaxID=2484750 RepID=A0A4Q6XXJ5_9SPHN|nr:diguanylate cyclase [Sphingomonas populi]
MLTLAWLLAGASAETRENFRWVTHSGDVIGSMRTALIDLREAESGQRGFVLTGNNTFVGSFERHISDAHRAIARVVGTTTDNPVQNARARELLRLMDQRAVGLRSILKIARQGGLDQARAVVASGHGLELMNAISLLADGFLEEERSLRDSRIAVAGERLTRLQRLALVGGSLLSLLVVLVSALVIRGIRRPVDVIRDAMTALGRGDHDVRITAAMGSREFGQLADGYNRMADRLEAAIADQGRSERDLKIANDELLRNSDALQDRGEAIELLGGMAHRMQAARTDDELGQVIRVFVPLVLPGIAGALYAHNNSRNMLLPIAGWGGLAPEREGFAPNQCWALRRGQSHFVSAPGSDIVCAHVADAEMIYHCEPLLAGGEVIGTLCLLGAVTTENRFRLTVMAENIASALVNHRLQRDLREQTIRDPLTGLFNRRYMEEALSLEIARARRSGAPLSVVMCDVDHFKRFNDEFGHDAGDTVLQAVATEMQSRFRDGDLVCRFGGEEFTIIAPGTTAEALAGRVESVRQAISEISLRQGGRLLGSTSMSFGIATWDASMNNDGSSLVQLADAALYRAKRDGRNRTAIEPTEEA